MAELLWNQAMSHIIAVWLHSQDAILSTLFVKLGQGGAFVSILQDEFGILAT